MTVLPPMYVLAKAAAELARAARDAGDLANERAINNGDYDLHTGSVPMETTGGYLVPSHTRAMAHRVSDTYGCSCEAGSRGRPCRHAAQIEIIAAARTQVLLGHRLAARRWELLHLDELY